MSVVQIVRNQEFISRLREIYPAYQIRPTNSLLVTSLGGKASHIGTAFDYVLRIMIARHQGFKHPHFSWEADHIATILRASDDSVSTRVLTFGAVKEPVVIRRDGLGARRHIWALDTLARAKSHSLKYHLTGIIEEDFLWTMFQVSYLEMIVRSGKVELLNPDDLESYDIEAIQQLKALTVVAESAMLKASVDLYLSPYLKADYLTRGASPDILADGWVCDIKVVSKFSDATQWVDQMLIYAALIELGGIELSHTDYWVQPRSFLPMSKIQGVAIYFARHAEWCAVKINQIMTPLQFRKLQELLCEEYLGSRNIERVRQLKNRIKRECI